jgi:hypothetical protein
MNLPPRVRPNLTLNQTCNSVRRLGFISFWPGLCQLPHACQF